MISLEEIKKELFSKDTVNLLVRHIKSHASETGGIIRIMEVCGTHTMSLRLHGIHSLLPENIRLISGPGCPVCVTPSGYIENIINLLEQNDFTVATFGDMLKVPDSRGRSLSEYTATGRIRIIYSPEELLGIKGPVLFPGIGFETTIPGIASVLKRAVKEKPDLYIYTALKRIEPALKALVAGPEFNINAFLLPGHVSSIIGLAPYSFLEKEDLLPGVVTGFEPSDMLYGIMLALRCIREKKNIILNAYPRAVKKDGNTRALTLMNEVFKPGPALWRGLGSIPESGFVLRDEYAFLDAEIKFKIPPCGSTEDNACICSRIIIGRNEPEECPLFGKACTPESAIGPCMVSSEGPCAAHYKYGN